MKTIGIEDTLLEYHNVIDKNWKYKIELVDQLPENTFDIRSVCINKVHIHFFERMDVDNAESIIYWKLDSTISKM